MIDLVDKAIEVSDKPLVIEFAGTPNSGKDTQIAILGDYLRDYRGFSVSVYNELYDSSRIISTYHDKLFWMVGSIITKLVEIQNQKEFDVVIINRGLFDILAFINLYLQQEHISNKESVALSSILTTKSLCKIEDIVIVLKTSPEVSLQREKVYPRNTVGGLAKKLDFWNPNPPPTLTNKNGLEMINKCYDKALEKYRRAFIGLIYLEDNGDETIDDVAISIGSYIHPLLPGDIISSMKEQLIQRRKSFNRVSQLSFSDILKDMKSKNL